ncbi:MAG: gliding motility-associated C-terminal domain-containing protein [Flavobacteriales bacterium]
MRTPTCLLAACIAWSGFAQDPWVREVESNGPEHIADVVPDAAGNTYIIGDFSFSVTLDGTTVTTAGARDVVVAKLDPEGDLIWMRRAGGTGFDLGLKLALGPNDALAVTGSFTGTVDLFGNAVSSNGGTTDFFLAVLNASDGVTQWVRSGGSDVFADTPGAVTISPNGNVTVAGKFKGTAVFDGGSLTSAIDPWTQDFGFDVFIQAYSSAGASLWLQRGSGSHDEEAVELVSDDQDNVYVTGQYSDTLTFDLSHPNIALNSIYVVRFDAGGQEQWFRKCGGTIYNHVTDMRIGSDGNLLLCGDVQGDMQWIDGVPIIIPSVYDNAYFILRASSAGTLLNSTTMGSANEVRSGSIAEQADSIVVYGDFQCDFTGLQAAYQANGLFMATGTHDFFISKHAKGDLGFIKAQQWGGGGDVRAGQVEAMPDGGLVFCGSYNSLLIFPALDNSWGENVWGWCGVLSDNISLTYCGDPDYGDFAHLYSAGLMDGFVGRCLVESREPYDFWDRNGQPPCTRVNLLDSICIRPAGYSTCVDTVVACTSVDLLAQVPFPVNDLFCWGSPTVAPMNYAGFWENGGGGMGDPLMLTATWTGWFHFSVYAFNGCWSVVDSIYVIIIEPPLPHFSSSNGLYSDQWPIAPCAQIQSCDSMWLIATLIQPDETFTWSWPGGPPTNADSVFTVDDGTYILTVTDTNGCSTQNKVCVDLIDAYQPPNVTGIDFTYLLDGDTITLTDTAYTCSPCVYGQIHLQWYIDSIASPPPPGIPVDWYNPNGCYPISAFNVLQPVVIPWSVDVDSAGWHYFYNTLHFDNLPCDSDVFDFHGMDSVFIVPVPGPHLFMPQNVPACAGDTVTLVVSCTDCDSLYWNPDPAIIYTSAFGDTIVVNDFGSFTVHALNTENGVMCSTSSYVSVYTAPLPNIYINPQNGVICPNDSAIVYTYGWATGTGYQWQGPGGIITTNNDSIFVTEPGDYYLTVTTVSGCPVSNGPVTLTEFSSPFIQALPTNILCTGGSVGLEVVSGPGATLQWQAPLSGSSPTQTVYQPGVYSCNVTSCGVVWELEIEVFASGIVATVDAGPGALCSDDPLVMVGPDSAAQYLWLPDNVFTQTLTVYSPGEFQLIVFDQDGCSDTSAVITVDTMAFTQPLVAWGDTVCSGDVAVLTAIGSDSLSWFNDSSATAAFAFGTSIPVGPLLQTDTVYVVQTENGCSGDPQAVIVVVVPMAPLPQISGDTVLCEGEDLLLSVQAQSGIVYDWATPTGPDSGTSISITDATTANAGIYSVVASGPGLCDSGPAHVTVMVTTIPSAPSITGDTVLCLGDALLLTASAPAGTAVTWTTPLGEISGTTVAISGISAQDAGTYACYITDGECSGVSVSVEVSVVGPISPATLSGTTELCVGEALELLASGTNGNAVVWTPPSGQPIATNPMILDPATVIMTGAYVCTVEGEPCPDALASIAVVVEDCEVIIPNVFSPNADGSNDIFVIEAPFGLELSIRLYNRWGQLVAELSGRTIRWDGKRTDNREAVPDGVYYYVLPLPERLGGGERTGYVQLLNGR